ncbi:guanine deaminase [Pelagibaculum spongiae]|nr:guanine deaminase [Pelagibaculum spongiae]
MAQSAGNLKAFRGSLVDIAKVVDQPQDIDQQVRSVEDGLLIVKDGKIEFAGEYQQGKLLLADDVLVHDYRGKLIVPGFIDAHIHYPQLEMIGAHGEQLLEWLNTYTFPTERKYGDKEYATAMAKLFLDQLFRNGTTTALVFCSVHPESVDALFEQAENFNMRVIAGKVMMDRNAPDYLLDTPESSYSDSKALIEKWHKKGRALYAITPRFAPTSTPEQLELAGRLREEYPDTYLHTHLSENLNEIAWVKELFPEQNGYLDVYDHYKLVGERSVFAHGVHLEDHEFCCMGDKGAAIAFCPTSNLYLGSGLFKLHKTWQYNVRVGMGTDIGAGTSFNMLQTLNEAYKVCQLQGKKLSAFESFYHATLGGARSLYLEDKLGNFDQGKEADFVVMDPAATSLQQLRWENSKSLAEKLFVLMTIGDDRNIYRTYVDGKLAFQK